MTETRYAKEFKFQAILQIKFELKLHIFLLGMIPESTNKSHTQLIKIYANGGKNQPGTILGKRKLVANLRLEDQTCGNGKTIYIDHPCLIFT